MNLLEKLTGHVRVISPGDISFVCGAYMMTIGGTQLTVSKTSITYGPKTWTGDLELWKLLQEKWEQAQAEKLAARRPPDVEGTDEQ